VAQEVSFEEWLPDRRSSFQEVPLIHVLRLEVKLEAKTCAMGRLGIDPGLRNLYQP